MAKKSSVFIPVVLVVLFSIFAFIAGRYLFQETGVSYAGKNQIVFTTYAYAEQSLWNSLLGKPILNDVCSFAFQKDNDKYKYRCSGSVSLGGEHDIVGVDISSPNNLSFISGEGYWNLQQISINGQIGKTYAIRGINCICYSIVLG